MPVCPLLIREEDSPTLWLVADDAAGQLALLRTTRTDIDSWAELGLPMITV
jgi:hypothetical protein